MKQQNKGVMVDDERISILMFADEIVFIIIYGARKTKMVINILKTKVMHKRKRDHYLLLLITLISMNISILALSDITARSIGEMYLYSQLQVIQVCI